MNDFLRNEDAIFSELNHELAKHNLDLTVICVGGYVLQHHDIRATADVDGFFAETPDIRAIIRRVGEKFQINGPDELWLNNSVQNLNDIPPKSICKTVHVFSNLKILMPPLEYIAVMKLNSGREQDIDDVAQIIKKTDIKDIDDFYDRIKPFSSQRYDESLLLEAFGHAYGMDWLVDYYTKQEANLLNEVQDLSSESMKENIGTKTKKHASKHVIHPHGSGGGR